MDENEKHFKEIDFKGNFELNMTKFYKELNKAISTKNVFFRNFRYFCIKSFSFCVQI